MTYTVSSGTLNLTQLISVDLSLWLDSPIFWEPDTKACPPTPSFLFPVPPGRELGYGCAN